MHNSRDTGSDKRLLGALCGYIHEMVEAKIEAALASKLEDAFASGYGFDIMDHEEYIKEIAQEVIQDTNFSVTVD